MMKRNLFYAVTVLLATSLVGCSNEEGDLLQSENSTVVAGIDNQSRTALGKDNSTVVWSAGDQIYLFGGNSNATMTLVSGEGDTEGTFSGPINGYPSELTKALYPVPQVDGNTYTYEFPSQITYSENSNAPMVGGLTNRNITFSNLVPLVRVPLVNLDGSNENIVKLNLTGSPIVGKLTVRFDENGNCITEFEETENIENAISVVIPENITNCYVDFPIPVGTYTEYKLELNGSVLTEGEIEEDEQFLNNNSAVIFDLNKSEEPETPSTTEDPYEIKNISQLIWLADEVNNGNDFKGITLKLMEDIDLSGIEWTPIGNSQNKFKGIFDGQGHTISNLYISGSKNYVGLFGMTTDGEIKNLVIENAKVSGRNSVGVVAGSPYTSKYSNITLIGKVEVNGKFYVGGVGGRNAYASWTDITVDVEEGSYVKANSVEDGVAYRTYIGGVIGFMGEGNHVLTNVKSNIDVIGSTIDVGGITGIAHYGNKFINCSSSGNVTLTDAADAVDAEEMGGIAGVWHNQNATTVTFTDCTFTGTLTSNIEEVNLTDNTIVGKAYNSTGTGKLIIDGTVNVLLPDVLVASLEAGESVKLLNDIKIDPAAMSNAYGTTGVNVKQGQTIDGAGYTLDISGAGGTWDSGINTTGGLIKNITVTGSFRGIFVNHNSDHAEKVILENVVIDGTTYTISCDQGKSQGLEATNSTFNGWTSYAATIGDVKFTGCNFGEGRGYAFCRPYAPTTFINCAFEAGYIIDPRAAVTFDNCTFDGVLLSADNIESLVTNTSNVVIE